ncbi:MAG: hypothetical protein Fur0014_13820 [Rubrivivax sp.]
MIICICRRVSDRDIARAAREGCASFDELQFELAVATCCGKCRDCARQAFEQHAAQASTTWQRADGRAPDGPGVIAIACPQHPATMASATA